MASQRRASVLHIVDPTWPGGGPATLRLAALVAERLVSFRHAVVVLGGRRELELARRCGLAPVGAVALPAGIAALGFGPLRRAARAIGIDGTSPSLLHAWSGRAAIAGAAVAAERRLVTLDRGPADGLQHEMLGALLAAEDHLVLAIGNAAASELEAAGILRSGVRTLPPGIGGSDDPPARAALRKRWGVGESRFVLGLLGGPPDASDVRDAFFVTALAAVAGRDVHLVVHPAAPGLDRMLDWAGAPGLRRALAGRISLDARIAEPWAVAYGLDAGLALGEPSLLVDAPPLGTAMAPWLGSGRPVRRPPAAWGALWFAAAGRPTIADATAQAAEFVVEGVTGLLVGPGDYPAAAHRVLRLCDDRTRAARLGAAAREAVRERFDAAAFTVRMRAVYEAVLRGRRVPDPLPGLERSGLASLDPTAIALAERDAS
ncbi:MAG TPA: hypothetical protein PKC43_04750 [Phycisphaerales bacterium]|nr:hypothetical protein [Phycisphaerales bacterium]HMP36737.1 hypothetical protein [Phycisphaerales bacterium]